MNENYGECPTCGKNKIYLSQANILVCGNKKCGQIFFQLSSKNHLQLQQALSKATKMLEDYEKYRKAVEDAYPQLKAK